MNLTKSCKCGSRLFDLKAFYNENGFFIKCTKCGKRGPSTNESVLKSCELWEESIKRQETFCLTVIAGGATPEEVAENFGVDLKTVETIIAEDLKGRGNVR